METTTFEQLVQYGKDNGANIVNGMPWSFNFKGHAVTHENDELYLIVANKSVIRFSKGDVLISNDEGIIYTRKMSELSDLFEL